MHLRQLPTGPIAGVSAPRHTWPCPADERCPENDLFRCTGRRHSNGTPDHDGNRRLARSGYSFYMAEQWRVSVIFAGREASKHYHPSQLHALLLSRLGDDITISAGKLHIFMYAETAQAAEQAEHATRQSLTQLGLSEDCRLERWDSSSQEWRDVRSGLPAAQEPDPETTRLRAVAGKVAAAWGALPWI